MIIKNQLIGCRTILRKDMQRNLRVWRQSFIPPAISSILYFIIFGNLVGRNVGDLHGFTYSQFIAPGLIMMHLITNAYSNCSSSIFVAKLSHYIEEILVSPLTAFFILLGFMLGGIFRGMVVAGIVTVISFYFTHVHLYSLIIFLIVSFLTAMIFSLAGIINALFAKTFDDINVIPVFVLTPLIYLSGVFYSLHVLPHFWQTVSLFNPLIYIVNSARYGYLGYHGTSVFVAISILMLIAFGLFAFTYYLIKKGYGLVE